MGSSAVLLAKRALVVLIRTLASTYNVIVDCTRDATDREVLASFRKVALQTHPDRGGNTTDQQKLNDARAAWDELRRQKTAAGRPKRGTQAQPQSGSIFLPVGVVPGKKGRPEYRVNAPAALFTYMAFDGGLGQWERFCDFVGRSLRRWGVKHWCATLETTKEGKGHTHLMLQFSRKVDRTTAAFVFEGICPNARSTDLCGDGLCRKRMQLSIDRGFYYVWVDKKGTLRDDAGNPCVRGNYAPVWTDERHPGQKQSHKNGVCILRRLACAPRAPPKRRNDWHERASEFDAWNKAARAMSNWRVVVVVLGLRAW